ncbi:MAG: serine/threonine-protein kinase [Deltaproteobacteria bacterium]
MHLGPGSQVSEKFRLTRLLGEGGMGCVWEAEHLALGVPVAMKFISERGWSHTGVVQRFLREAQVAARLRHPHVVQILDHGTIEGVPYIAMELLTGENLSRRLAREGPLTCWEVNGVIQQTAAVLTRAHQLGIVHRDIKPENLFALDGTGELFVKVLDFGLAKLRDADGGDLTAPSAVFGTPSYMSPEQLLSTKEADAFADLWALAVTAYVLLTGTHPFPASTPAGVAVAVCSGRFSPPASHRPELPTEIDAWFARAVAKNPDDRFASSSELAAGFLKALERTAQTSPSTGRSLEDGRRPSTAVGCLSNSQLLELVAGQLETPKLDAVDAHLDACSTCRHLAASVMLMLSSKAGASKRTTPPVAGFAPGTVIGHRYNVQRLLATGWMGELYEVMDEETQQSLGLKIWWQGPSDPSAQTRLAEELARVRQIIHPNVCRSHGFGEHGRPGSGPVWFVIEELVNGPTLEAHLSTAGRLPISEVRTIARQLLAGFHAAHELGVLHRNFRSGAVVVAASSTSARRVVITDFGFGVTSDLGAFLRHPDGDRLRANIAHLAPEQLEGGSADVATDIFAFGVVLFQMLTGQLPWMRDTGLQTALSRLSGSPPPPSRLYAEAAALDQVILKCLAHRPEDRYANVSSTLEALEAATAHISEESRRTA